MKTYFLSYNIMPTSTGDYFIALSNKLSETHKVFVVAGKIRDVKIKLNETITVLQCPSSRPTSLKDFWFLMKLVNKHKPDVMISMFGFVNMFLIVGWMFRVNVRVAWIRTISSHYTYKKYKVLRKSFIYGLATNIITNSNATKRDVNSFFKIPFSKITVLPNSVVDYSAKLQSIDTNFKNLLYVGRLHPGKGVDVLIKAFSALTNRFPDFHLDIIGGGDTLKALQNLANSLGVSDKVSFLGQKEKASVLHAYKKSYCTIIPSHSEAFGFTVIEAMSTGTCVVGANNTGIKEIIVPGETGLLFETGNSEDLANKLERLIEDLKYRNKLANAGYIRFLKFYETTHAISRDANFFNKLSKNY
ncbi:glycosyltransferase [Winogradskyella sediminis]|uniref:Glycosyltransferase involved in cell wall bisynthesis n=1 Tax=Winogradskyella sediminis TaxID=1382466 RepID=A0A1H1VKT5_9FLAO|nr:glycosyltransferase [Winogradskyella sediminis]SDS84649.1 Glycosyltransferase involved in cell wall bisynthesis [Winogradskyella sediminis]